MSICYYFAMKRNMVYRRKIEMAILLLYYINTAVLLMYWIKKFRKSSGRKDKKIKILRCYITKDEIDNNY